MIQDFTPRDRRAFPNGKPTTTGWTGVVKVVIGVQDLDAAIARYRSAFGLPAPERQEDAGFGAKLAWFSGTPVVLAAPLFAESWLSSRLQRFGDAPCAFILGTKHGVTGSKGSAWFGRSVIWAGDEQLGWRLGFQTE
jgi:catechol 2,3-dioxygenase-like lactoylglutathione lyase family enzyme